MKVIFKTLEKSSILAFLFALFVCFNILLNLYMPPKLALDLRFAYSASEAFSVLQTMGGSMRKQYLLIIWVLDMPYMIFYLLLLIGLICKIWKKKCLIILPIVTVLLDLFENLTVSVLILRFPSESFTLGYLASFFSTTKWIFVGACLLYIIVGLIRNLLNRRRTDLDLNS
ncbi:hypothetical protein ACPUEN_02190 [Algoriphagus yeomjeoni]|uniref:hypothetical protein n=1 Tax=Algoriphagus yeomjeoni TaxID=291403 RepID=UPI003CE466ED